MTVHQYSTALSWEGSTGAGYRAYGREHDVQISEEILTLSADAAFRGDASLPNPEQLLLAAASSCLLLSFLAVAARAHLALLCHGVEQHGAGAHHGWVHGLATLHVGCASGMRKAGRERWRHG